MAKPQKDGYEGMMSVYQGLRFKGRKVELAGYYAPFDLVVDDSVRVEVKTGQFQPRGLRGCPGWLFNIHRHGRINEKTDCYVLRLEGIPFVRQAINLLLSAPLRRYTVNVGYKQLLQGRWHQADVDFQTFKDTGKLPQNGAKP